MRSSTTALHRERRCSIAADKRSGSSPNAPSPALHNEHSRPSDGAGAMVVIHRQWRLHECFPIAPRTTANPGGINIGFRGRADRAPKLLERAELVVSFRGNAILRPQIRPACLGGQLDGSPRTLITSLAESVTGRRPSESLARFLCTTAILGVAHQVAYQVIGHEPRVCQGTPTTRLLDIVCIIGVLTGPVGRGFENICGSVCATSHRVPMTPFDSRPASLGSACHHKIVHPDGLLAASRFSRFRASGHS